MFLKVLLFQKKIILSWGKECAVAHKPGVWTRVSNYIKWLGDYINITPLSYPSNDVTITAEMSLDTTFEYSLDLEDINSEAYKAAVSDIKDLLSNGFDSAVTGNGLTVDEISITFSRATRRFLNSKNHFLRDFQFIKGTSGFKSSKL